MSRWSYSYFRHLLQKLLRTFFWVSHQADFLVASHISLFSNSCLQPWFHTYVILIRMINFFFNQQWVSVMTNKGDVWFMKIGAAFVGFCVNRDEAWHLYFELLLILIHTVMFVTCLPRKSTFCFQRLTFIESFILTTWQVIWKIIMFVCVHKVS